MKNLEKSLEAEKEAWISENKKQEASRFLERETELREQYRKERDRDIEAIIEMVEVESAKVFLIILNIINFPTRVNEFVFVNSFRLN